MNLLNDCSEEATEEKSEGPSRKCPSNNLSALRNCTVLAMSNLLNANIDSGLMHSIGTSCCSFQCIAYLIILAATCAHFPYYITALLM